MEIALEHCTPEALAEVLPLTQKCWNESTEFKGKTCAYYGERDFQIEPDRDAYLGLAAANKLILVTLRVNSELKGYVVGFLYTSLHHKHIPCGFGDSIYVEPEYRQHTWALAKRFEKEMKDRGVQILGWPVHFNGPVYEILKAKGYIGDDIVMEKRLCVSQPQ